MRAEVPFLQVFATDADDPDTLNAQLRFSIVNQIPNPGNGFYFGINPDSGDIFLTEEGMSTHLEQKDIQKNPYVVHMFCLMPNQYFSLKEDERVCFCCFAGAEFLRARPAVTYSRGEVRGSPDVLKKKFEDYCVPRNNIPLENNPFYTCIERAGENKKTRDHVI